MKIQILFLVLALGLSTGCTKRLSDDSVANMNGTVSRQNVVNIQATATDPAGITKVEFYVNGALTCTITQSPYTCPWLVPNVAKATYQLQTKAYDPAGKIGVSSIVTVTSN